MTNIEPKEVPVFVKTQQMRLVSVTQESKVIILTRHGGDADKLVLRVSNPTPVA